MTDREPATGKLGISRRTLLRTMAASVPMLALPEFLSAQTSEELYGGVFVVGTGTEPRHLNQNITTDIVTKMIASCMQNKLVGLKSDLTPKADLAKDWSVSDDGLIYTFNLHDGVKWHDGTPFTSEDAKFTFEQVLFKFHNQGKTLAPYVDEITTPDATTIVFHLNAPNDVMMTFIAGQGYIHPKHLYDGVDIMDSPANLAPIGTGPFKFASWNRGQDVAMELNDEYFMPGMPYVDRIVIRFIPEATARVRALEAGEVDYLAYNDLPHSMIADLDKNPDVTVTSKGHEAWGSIVELMMNLDKEPFNNRKVRMGIAHALDLDFIIEKATYGLATRATGPISSQLAWAYKPDTTQYPFDVAKANALLDEAGYPLTDGTRFSATIVANRGTESFIKAAQVIAEQLKVVGIDITVNPLDMATVAEQVYKTRKFDMFIQSLTTGPDPALGVQRQYIASNIRPVPYTNGIGYRDENVDALLIKAAQSPDRAERAELYKELADILCDDCALVWLYENPTYSAFRSAFGNLHTWAAESIYAYSNVYWKEGDVSRG
ncbi:MULTISPECIES: ABC transporter substrate-binding protein [Actibacterium]|uniref:Peptide/nickel transport system substrate-binding protein n=1 Tax=Actibacterium naphthalenivorans TaxID=1614693 RepID=A0A840CFA8_9RHOB|nr:MULTISPECIES: ABC transporter substrate-binding protein [Actibacterium]ALG90879.1 peptide ABC transporter substrate-binding protein [Actibacterium sp. EMB200-NS6]MBB4023990.1 peptide/nickel transport system substrate-binding protein [Actibacterium naphthalenivorans]